MGTSLPVYSLITSGVSLLPWTAARLVHAGVTLVPLGAPEPAIEVHASARAGNDLPELAAFLATLGRLGPEGPAGG